MALLSLLLQGPSGCARLQLMAPALLGRASRPRAPKPPRAQPTRPGTAYPGGITLRHLTVNSASTPPSASETMEFRHALSQTLDAAFPQKDLFRPPLQVDIRYRYRTQIRRWLVLDIFHMATLGLVFVTPEKGVATVVVDLTVNAPAKSAGQARTYRVTLRVRAPFKSNFTSWYDHSNRQKYLNHAHTVAFRKIVAHLRWWGSRGIAARPTPPRRTPPPKRTPPPTARSKSPRPKPRARPGRPLAWYDLELHVEGESKSVKRRWHGHTIVAKERVEAKERRTGLAKILKLLGGLSVGYSYGSVWARSNALDESGKRYSLASGRGTTHSVGVSLFRPPQNSGIYFNPTVGFLWERFTIGDVAGLADQGSQSGANDIPVIATDPDDPGRPVLNLGGSWRYRLIMTSLYLGLRAGGVMVWGSKTQFYLGLEGGANLAEWRYMDVLWDRYRDRGHAFAGAGSFAGRLNMGLVIRPWHLTFFVQAAYEYFREFAYPKPIPFRSRAVYDPSLGVWQRPVQTAKSLSLHALRFYCGVAVVY